MTLFQEQRFVFIGDSITDADRRTTHPPYGQGFVEMLRVMLLARYPERRPVILNRGVNGNTVRDLAARWQTDVIALKPDYLTVMVGINDVVRQFNPTPVGAVYPEEFRRALRDLIAQTQASLTLRKIFLMTPYFIHYDKALPIRKQMDAYGQIVHEVAGETGTTFVDVQAAFDDALRVTVPEFWAADGVHPFGPGHALIALTWLRAYGFEF